MCQTIEDVLCVPDEEKETMRAALLAQISEVALPEGDSDDEGDGAEGRESSDDGSDSDTVENVVLPSRCCLALPQNRVRVAMRMPASV